MNALSELLDQLAAGIPDLPGARCKGRTELFDQTAPREGRRGDHDALWYAQRAAVALCRACPSLSACRAWFDGLEPTQRPRGVVAGLVNAPGGVNSAGSPPRGEEISVTCDDAPRRGAAVDFFSTPQPIFDRPERNPSMTKPRDDHANLLDDTTRASRFVAALKAGDQDGYLASIGEAKRLDRITVFAIALGVRLVQVADELYGDDCQAQLDGWALDADWFAEREKGRADDDTE